MGEIVLDVWADVLSPWCYVNKHRLEVAISHSERPSEITVVYHAYQVEPDAPVGSNEPMVAHRARATGRSEDEVRTDAEHVAAAARPDRVLIDVDAQLVANTFDAHRIIALGLALGGPALQGAVLERLYAAAFAEGRAVDDPAVLQRLGAEAGLDERRLASVLASREFAEHVRDDVARAAQLGATGVPYMIANRHLALSDAQPIEVLERYLKAVFEDEPARR